jgi:hypothetical protein
MMDNDYRIKMALLRKPTRIVAQNALRPHTPDELRNMEIIRSRKLRLPQPSEQVHIVDVNPVVLFTGGIGDIFALESYFTDKQRNSLSTILYATNKQNHIQTLFEALVDYPNLKSHTVVWDDFQNFWCFLFKKEVIDRLGGNAMQELINCEDYGIVTKFQQIKLGKLNYNNSSFLKASLTDVTSFNLPYSYVILAPYSTDKRNSGRDFTQQDWARAIEWIANKDMIGVVINQGNDVVPDHSRIINLSNKTTILEAVEILKKAKAYIGIDTWLSVLAAKLFERPMLAIKSNNHHCYDNKSIYFAPKKTFDFLGNDLGKLLI